MIQNPVAENGDAGYCVWNGPDLKSGVRVEIGLTFWNEKSCCRKQFVTGDGPVPAP